MSPVEQGMSLRDKDARDPGILLVDYLSILLLPLLLLHTVRVRPGNDEELIVRPDGRVRVPDDHEAAQAAAEPAGLGGGEVRLSLQRREGDGGQVLCHFAVAGARVEEDGVDLSGAGPWRWGLLDRLLAC